MSWDSQNIEFRVREVERQLEEFREVVQTNQIAIDVDTGIGDEGRGLGANSSVVGPISYPFVFNPVKHRRFDAEPRAEGGPNVNNTIHVRSTHVVIQPKTTEDPIQIRTFADAIHDGQMMKVTVISGKTLEILAPSGTDGNVDISANITGITTTDVLEFVFSNQSSTAGSPNGAWVLVTDKGVGGDTSQWATFPAVENVKMNGNFFEQTVGNIYRFRIDGATEYLMTTLAFQLKNLNRIEFLDSSDVAKGIIEFLDPSLVYTITDVLGAHIFKNLTTTPTFILEGINTSDTLLAHELLFRGRSSTNVPRIYGSIKVRQNDTLNASELGEMEFRVIENGDDDVTYMELNALFQEVKMFKPISMGFRDILLVEDMTLNGIIRSRDTNEIGIQVGNEALTVGTEGSLIVPVVTGTAVPANDAALDTDFGNVDGAMGLFFDTDTATNSRIFGRLNGVWYHAFLTRTF